MKKLNNKGYITIEVLIASIVAAVIAVFLIEITVKLVTKTDDAYVDTILNTDKALIIKNIRENIQNDINNYGAIKALECSDDTCKITFENNNDKFIFVDNKKVRYCSGENNCSYEKTIDNGVSKLSIESKNRDINNEKYIFLQITVENIFAESDYIINIPINEYDGNTPLRPTYTVTISCRKCLLNEQTITVEENKILEGTVSISGTTAQYKSINCTNGISIEKISETKTKTGKDYTFKIGPVNSDTICTADFEQSSGSATS